MELPDKQEGWGDTLREVIQLTRSCGVLLVEQREKSIRALLETDEGTSCWDIPIETHGDIQALGSPVLRENEESLGLLWSRPSTTY